LNWDRVDSLSAVAGAATRLSDHSSEAEVCTLLLEVAKVLGGPIAFTTVIRDREAVETYRTLSGCDPRWALKYEEQAGYLSDPWLAHARLSADSKAFEDLPGATPTERAVVELAKRFGFSFGYVIPVHSPPGLTRLGVMYVATREGRDLTCPFSTTAFMATGLATRLQRWQVATLRDELTVKARIGPADLRLLRLGRSNQNSKAAARILGTTALSIDSRWQRLNAKLGVSSRSDATQLAAEYGLI
jgi:DNA-binding CsgD family transcriptional regulator